MWRGSTTDHTEAACAHHSPQLSIVANRPPRSGHAKHTKWTITAGDGLAPQCAAAAAACFPIRGCPGGGGSRGAWVSDSDESSHGGARTARSLTPAAEVSVASRSR